MAHKRSQESLQRREARKIVQTFAFQDFKLAESINRLTPEQIADQMAVLFPEGVTYSFAARYDRGEVLTDSRGQGSIQRWASHAPNVEDKRQCDMFHGPKLRLVARNAIFTIQTMNKKRKRGWYDETKKQKMGKRSNHLRCKQRFDCGWVDKCPVTHWFLFLN